MPSFVIPFDIATLVKPVQPENTEFPTIVTVLGNIKLFKAVQPLNAFVLIVVKPSLLCALKTPAVSFCSSVSFGLWQE